MNVHDFSLFISIPDASMNIYNILLMFLASLIDTLPNRIISSTNCWCVMGRLFPHGFRPLILFSLSSFLRFLAKPSISIMNKNGEI